MCLKIRFTKILINLLISTKMKRIFLFTVLLSLFLSNTLFSQKKTVITGNVLNNKDFTSIILMSVPDAIETANTTISATGDFTISFDLEKTGFYKLQLDENISIFLIPEPGENINVNFDLMKIYEPIIQGSKNSELVYKMVNETGKKDKEIENYTAKIQEEKREIIRKMIKENPTSLAGLFFINELQMEEDLETYKILTQGIKQYSYIQPVKELVSQVDSLNIIEVGSIAPDIILKNADGKEIKLSSLRGKYVLIDFWASWCRPCRGESANLVKMYKKYNKSGFEIYSVSLDEKKEDWVGAIKKDGLSAWTHVSDLQYWNSAAAKQYKVTSIPYTLLLDKEGKIIAKELRGEELAKKLSEIFPK